MVKLSQYHLISNRITKPLLPKKTEREQGFCFSLDSVGKESVAQLIIGNLK